jgi:hypothetical protein
MEPAPEGLVEVASPPASAGKRGIKIRNRDWELIVEFLRARPWRRFLVMDEPAGWLSDLRKKYPDIEFVGHNNHLAETAKGLGHRQVCDIYVRCTEGKH